MIFIHNTDMCLVSINKNKIHNIIHIFHLNHTGCDIHAASPNSLKYVKTSDKNVLEIITKNGLGTYVTVKKS